MKVKLNAIFPYTGVPPYLQGFRSGNPHSKLNCGYGQPPLPHLLEPLEGPLNPTVGKKHHFWFLLEGIGKPGEVEGACGGSVDLIHGEVNLRIWDLQIWWPLCTIGIQISFEN